MLGTAPQGPRKAQGQWRNGKSADEGGHGDGAEAAHETGAGAGLRNRAEVGGIVGHKVGEGDGVRLKIVGGGGPCAAAARGVQKHGGGAAVIIERGADLFDAPEVRDGHIGSALAFAGGALVAAGSQAKVGKESPNVAIGVEVFPILTGVGESRHQ